MIFRPLIPYRLTVRYFHQQHDGECLAAAAYMLCDYLKISLDYKRLVRTLGIQRNVGTPFSSIRNLQKLGILVGYRENGNIQTLHQLLSYGWPIIVSVQTDQLPYWNGVTSTHAVVVIGMNRENIYVHDPALGQPEMPIALGDFDLAWFEQSEAYAVLAP